MGPNAINLPFESFEVWCFTWIFTSHLWVINTGDGVYYRPSPWWLPRYTEDILRQITL